MTLYLLIYIRYQTMHMCVSTYSTMASYDDIPIQVHVEDVPFRRTTSTRQWAASPSTSSSRHKSHHSSHHHKKARRQESGGGHLLSGAGRLESSLREQYGGRREVTRVAGKFNSFAHTYWVLLGLRIMATAITVIAGV